MRIRAALAREIGQLTIKEVELDPPHADEVLVRLIIKRYALQDLIQAFEDMEAGRLARGVLIF
jgi:Zn-dependent alcohol dehydrogenase